MLQSQIQSLLSYQKDAKKRPVINIRPRYNRLVVKPIDKEYKTDKGLIIPIVAQGKELQQAVVLRVGAGNPGQPIEDLEIGSCVLHSKGAGTTLPWGDEKETINIIRDNDLQAEIEV